MLSGLDPCDEMCNLSHKFGRRDQDPIHKESVSCYGQKEQTYLIKLFLIEGRQLAMMANTFFLII